MAEILRPSFILFRRFAFLSREKGQRLPEAVRVEVGQARRREALLEDRPNRARSCDRERFLTGEELERLGSAIREAETTGVPWKVDESIPNAKHVPKAKRVTKIDPFAAAVLDDIVAAFFDELQIAPFIIRYGFPMASVRRYAGGLQQVSLHRSGYRRFRLGTFRAA
jgi:hypothetical protein